MQPMKVRTWKEKNCLQLQWVDHQQLMNDKMKRGTLIYMILSGEFVRPRLKVVFITSNSGRPLIIVHSQLLLGISFPHINIYLNQGKF